MRGNGERRLELCAHCGRGGYDHRRVAVLVDGVTLREVGLCRAHLVECALELDEVLVDFSRRPRRPAHERREG